MQNASKTLLLLTTVSLTSVCVLAVFLPTRPLTEEETVHAYLDNGGYELIRKALDLPEGVYYNPLAHFSRDDAPPPKTNALSRQLKSDTPSNIEVLRSLGYFLPGLDDESLLHNGYLHRLHAVSRQGGGGDNMVRGSKSVFSVVYRGGAPDSARTAFESALRTWANNFQSKVVLNVLFRWERLPGQTLAAANSPFLILGKGVNGLKRDTAYTPAMAAALSGNDMNPGNHHIEISFNSRQSWHFDLNRNAPNTMFDLATVALHEQCHGLFFSGAILGDALRRSSRFVSKKERPARFDQFIQTSSGTGIARSCDAREIYEAITTPGLRFRTTTGNSSFGLYAPMAYQLGSSTYHFDAFLLRRDCNTFGIPLKECSDLMTFELDRGYTMREIGEPTFRVMRSVLSQEIGLAKSDVCDIPPAVDSASPPRPGIFGFNEPGKPLSLPTWVVITVASVGAAGAIIVLYFIATAFFKN